jgi:hypothetical protein
LRLQIFFVVVVVVDTWTEPFHCSFVCYVHMHLISLLLALLIVVVVGVGSWLHFRVFNGVAWVRVYPFRVHGLGVIQLVGWVSCRDYCLLRTCF